MAVLKPKKDDLFHSSLVPVTEELYVFLVKTAETLLNKELRFITSLKLRSAVQEYIEFRGRNGIICVLPRNRHVYLTIFLQGLTLVSEVEAHVELRVSLPVIGTVSEHEEVWKRLLAKNFPNHVVRDGELCILLDLYGDDVPENRNGVFCKRKPRVVDK
jgi:hypothetical protein